MNDALKMQISAFVDGELPENEAELLMRRLSQDLALRELVSEYLKIGRLIRRDREIAGMDGLRGRIQSALGEQPIAVESSAPARGSRLLRPVAGLAVAATVAAVALLGLRQVDVSAVNGQTASVQTEPDASVAGSAGYTEPQPAQVLSSRPSEMLIQYYLSHDATSRDLGANGILTRLVTLELREGELVAADPDADSDADAPEAVESTIEMDASGEQEPPDANK
jgi:sigma-E factor negative regulatory protein RseA